MTYQEGGTTPTRMIRKVKWHNDYSENKNKDKNTVETHTSMDSYEVALKIDKNSKDNYEPKLED